MPVYLNCPHCEHPQVVPARRRGKAVFCRQCGRAYRTSTKFDGAQALPISSYGELHESIKRSREALAAAEA